MAKQVQDESGFNKFPGAKRKTVKLSQEVLINTSYLNPEEKFALVIQPNIEKVNLGGWAEGNREYIEKQLLAHGAILFRNFKVTSVERFSILCTCSLS